MDTEALTTTTAAVPELMPAAARVLDRIEARPPAPFTATSSDRIEELVAGLAAAQLAFEAIDKNKLADVQSRREGARSYKYRYADLGEVLSVVRPKLAEHGVAIIQLPRVEGRQVTVTTILAHTSGQWIRNELQLPLDSTDPQAIGSGITYARRYSLQALLGVAPETDDDGAAAGGGRSVEQPSNKPSVPLPQRASANGHGAPASEAAAGVAAAAPLVITRLQKKASAKGDPYWVLELTDKRQAMTFSTEIGGRLETWFKAQTPITDMATTPKGKYIYIDEITAAARSEGGDRAE